MSSKSEKDRIKQIQDKCQTVLNALLRDEDNKYCVDCDSKGPRWASWNLGVFLCIRCAGIHRNLGVHISKVKSVNLDSWTPEQVVSLQQMGNSRARAVYEANIPDNFRRPQSDSHLESFIRAKYDQKKFIAREWVPPTLPKVNWEKEIDEELERQKRKKKSNMEQKKPLSIVEVPQIPKPKNASPKTSRILHAEVKAPVPVSSAATDLLSLQNGEDNFTSFLSAPKSDDAHKTKQEDIETFKSEEESFFNQPAPSEKEKVKLTKDSILALYGNAPQIVSQNNFTPNYQQTPQFQPQNFTNFSQNFNGPTMQQQQQQQQQSQFQGNPTQFQQMNQFPPQSGMPFQPMFQQFAPTNQFQTPSSQFPNPPTAASTQFQPMGQFQQQAPQQFTQQQAFGNNAMQFGQQQQQNGPNPFFGQQPNNLQQQFNNMSLGNPPKQGTASVASNVWQ